MSATTTTTATGTAGSDSSSNPQTILFPLFQDLNKGYLRQINALPKGQREHYQKLVEEGRKQQNLYQQYLDNDENSDNDAKETETDDKKESDVAGKIQEEKSATSDESPWTMKRVAAGMGSIVHEASADCTARLAGALVFFPELR